jgi:hypothetical protein
MKFVEAGNVKLNISVLFDLIAILMNEEHGSGSRLWCNCIPIMHLAKDGWQSVTKAR